ncbi:MAG: hypothetical protein MUC92_00500 [Fimbriimonadaceae bacterium]|jgi:hypothetical protein|nr:hypothetical protein [Fimbriimonadaceae bacterium]
MKSTGALKLSVVVLAMTLSGHALVAQSVLPSLLLANAPESNPAPQIDKVTLVNLTFGNNPTVVVKNPEGKQRTISVRLDAKISNDKTTGTLTKMAQTEIGKSIHIMTQRTAGAVSVTRMWDAESYADWVNAHNGTRNGQVRGLFPKALHLGDHVYTITDNTRFVLEGKNVGRKKLEGRDVLWVKCVVKNGVALADVIADTSTSIGATPTGTNTRPQSGGRPPSVSNPNGPRTRGESGTSPTERGGRPDSVGDGTKSPTERPSTARTMTIEERARQDEIGWKVKVTLEILDSDDNPTTGEATEPLVDVANEVSRKVGVGDQRVEVYANFSIFGSSSIEWKREDAEDRKHMKGDKIVLKDNNQEWRLIKHGKLIFQGYFRDRDQLSKDDELIDIDKSWPMYDLWVAKRTVVKLGDSKAQFIIEVEK